MQLQKKLTPTDVNSMAGNNPKKLMDLQLKYFEKTMGGKYNTWYQTTSYYGCIKMSAKKYKKSKKTAKKLAYIFHGSYERSGDTFIVDFGFCKKDKLDLHRRFGSVYK